MRIVDRGSTVVFPAGFTDNLGAVTNPPSANMYVTYKRSGVAVTVIIAMTQSGNSWTASWDSSPADAGQVDWCVKSAGSNKAAIQGAFLLVANAANPAT